MPDSLVKSFPSSASAFAGSQAAQHKVSCLLWAAAGALARVVNATPAKRANAPPVHFVHLAVSHFRMCFPSLEQSFRSALGRKRCKYLSPNGQRLLVQGRGGGCFSGRAFLVVASGRDV